MAMKLLFICTGNTCRSPMAEALAKSLFGSDAEISSAGIAAWEGASASEQAIAVMKERGLDLAEHRARRVSEELLSNADWIIPMTQEHERELRKRYPHLSDKIRRLGAWASSDQDVKDPYGGSVEVYRQSADQIEGFLLELRKELDRLSKKGE